MCYNEGMVTEKEILQRLATDPDLQLILHIVQNLHLKDAWLCAGTIRNFIWNSLSNQSSFDQETDVDVIFYDQSLTWEDSLHIEAKLKKDYPNYRWELRNQAHMHTCTPNTQPYISSQDAMSKYPETCTAIGIRLDEAGQLELFCAYGLESITSFEIRPTPHFLADNERMASYRHRLAKKDWLRKWPQLTILSE